jgi:hypothetical protein
MRKRCSVPDRERQLALVPVVAVAGGLGRVDLGGMAVHGRVARERWRGAAVIVVGVAEHDAADAAERRRGRLDRARHALLAGVEDGHPAARGLLDEKDVHRPGRPAADEPDAVGDALRRSGGDLLS